MLQKNCECRKDRVEGSLWNEVLETGVWLTKSRNGWNMRTLEIEMEGRQELEKRLDVHLHLSFLALKIINK